MASYRPCPESADDSEELVFADVVPEENNQEYLFSDLSETFRKESFVEKGRGKAAIIGPCVLAFCLTIVKSAPFFLAVQNISRIETRMFVPCSEHTCTFMRYGTSGYLHRTLRWGVNPYHTVQNGASELYAPMDGYLSPLCSGNSSAAMVDFCDREVAMDGIANHMTSGMTMYVYLICFFLWCASKLIHDWLLICGCSQHYTIKVGLASWILESAATAVCFVWCKDISGVFLSAFPDKHCGCYYILPELESILSMVTPITHLVLTVFKKEKILRSALFGDFLYSVRYDVPYYILSASLPMPMDSYIVERTYGIHGNVRPPWVGPSAIDKEKAKEHQEHLACVSKCYNFFIKFYSAFVHLLIGLCFGPISVRFLDILMRSTQCRYHCSVGILVIAGAVFMTWSQINTFFSVEACSLHQTFKAYRSFRKVKKGMVALVRVSIVACATVVMLSGLRISCGRSTVDRNPQTAFVWSLAVSFYIYLFITLFYEWRVKSLSTVVKVKCGMSRKPAEAYVQLHVDYPEYGLHSEHAQAQEFLDEHGPTTNMNRQRWSGVREQMYDRNSEYQPGTKTI